MRLRGRVARAAGVVAAWATAGCPGPGVVNRLATEDTPDPPPCPDCGGCHVLVLEEIIVEAGPDGRPVEVAGI